MDELVEIGVEALDAGLDIAGSQKNPKSGCGCLIAFLGLIGIALGLCYWLV